MVRSERDGLLDVSLQLGDGQSHLLHGVAVANGYATVGLGIKVVGDAKGRTDLVLTAVALTDGAGLVELHVEVLGKQEIQSLEADILHSTDFYDKLFSDVSEKGYKVLKDFYAQAKDTLDNAQVSADGVVVEVPVKDADGKFVKKAVKVTVAEFEKMKQQVIAIQRELEKKNPFAAFKTSWSDLMKAMKNASLIE